MTTELTKAAQQALEALELIDRADDDRDILFISECDALDSAIEGLTQALTTSQPAQAGEVDERVAFEAWLGREAFTKRSDSGKYESAHVDAMWSAWQARASLPTKPAAQATPEDMKVYDGIAADYFAETQQATPEPVLPFLVRDVAALLGASVPDVCKALTHLGHGQRSTNMEIKPEEALAVAEHIRAKPATPPQQAAGEPVGEVVRDTLGRNGRPWLGVTWAPGIDLPEGTKIYTHPAPGVPEGWRNVIAGTLKTDPWDSARVADYNSGWNDCQRKTLRGLERLAAAQAKGGEQ